MPVSPSPQIRQKTTRGANGTPTKPKATGAKATPDKQTKTKPVDFGKAIGIDRPANIRDKIARWQIEQDSEQSTPNAVATASEDDVNVEPPPEPKNISKPKALDVSESPKPTTLPAQEEELLAEKPKSSKKLVHNKLDEDVRIASAPKKRVVSDSHWRKNKSPPKDSTGKPDQKPLPKAWVRPAAKPKPKTPTKPETNPIATPTSKGNANGTAPKIYSTRQRRRSRPTSSGNDERPGTNGSTSCAAEKSEDGGPASPASPVSPKPESPRIRASHRKKRSPRASLSAEDETPSKSQTIRRYFVKEDAPEVLVLDPSPPPDSADDGDRRKRRSGHRREYSDASPERAPKEAVSTERKRSRRKTYQHDISLDSLSRPIIPETPPRITGNRIESWLSTTPDPFVESGAGSRRTSRSPRSTSDLSHRREDKSEREDNTLAKDEHDDEGSDRKPSIRRRTRTRSVSTRLDTDNLDDKSSGQPVSETADILEPSDHMDGTPSPSLRRRGAKRTHHSPTKSRSKSLSFPAPDVHDDEVASTAPSSSVDASTIDLNNIPIRTRPDSLVIRRGFPSTGKRLSTIASVETFSTRLQAVPPSETNGSEITLGPKPTEGNLTASESDNRINSSDAMTTLSRRSTRRKLASHADLMSVLSMPRGGTKSIMSARSIRTNRSRLATATMSDMLNELASDETKYMRELRTLVDGVIPVLLTCVLSKSDSAVAAGLFSRSAAKNDPTITRPIVDMGIALERLKGLHKRIPKDNPDMLLSWATSAHRIYSDYLKSWRLGFQDVVVNLAPATNDPTTSTPVKNAKGPGDADSWEEGMPRNDEGYVINGDGERVDVAFLLKRPLVRLKYLSKTFKGINHIKPSDQAEKTATTFQNLVADARKRSDEERARMEDEAAANIDATRARDPRSLAPLAGVRIDSHRCVRARDYFDMHLPHSSGQEVDCRVELLLRDETPGAKGAGDVLLCEVDSTGRWLFFPPIQQNRISARNGDLQGEIVVMVRGMHSGGQEWNELLSLRTDDEQAGFEWVQMLGLEPVPPPMTELKREKSFVSKAPQPTSSHASSSLLSAGTGSTLPLKSRTPSPHEIEVPIGEQANPSSKRWGYDTPDRRSNRQSAEVSPITPPSSQGSDINRRSTTSPVSPPSPLDTKLRVETDWHTPSPRPSSHDDNDRDRTPRSLNEAMMMAGDGSPVSLKRTRAKRLSKNPPQSSSSKQPSRQIVLDDPPSETEKSSGKLSKKRPELPHTPTSSTLSQSSKSYSVWMPSSEAEDSDESDDDEHPRRQPSNKPQRPRPHRRASSVPSMDLPTIPKIRKSSQPSTPVKETRAESSPVTTPKHVIASAPSKLQKKKSKPLKEEASALGEDSPPPVPPHRSPSPATPVTLKGSNTPVFTPTLPDFKTKRRSSSPLKHEYEPSTCTESSSESEDGSFDDEDSLTSESSEDELEDDVPTPLIAIGQSKFPRVSPPSSIYTLPNGTITPSQSASNTPYRTVPRGSDKATKTIASIFSWSDAGKWESLHPDECSIVITPGKIEAFELTAAHSKPLVADGEDIMQPDGKSLLVCLELTPLVPLRRGTALDISIRSPPTAESRIRAGNNVMFRSRSPEECEALYAMINVSRINNPTYIALQNARGPYGQSNWAEAMDRQNAARSTAGSSGFWGNIGGTLGRRSSYRASSTRAASISAVSESSVGTMASAFSALKRFSGTGRLFNIHRSTLSSRDASSRSSNSFDSGSAGSGSGISTPNPDGSGPPGRAPNAPMGITNTKIRLYERETQSKWRDMGSARLTIMLPDPNTPQSATRQGVGSPGVKRPSQEKRIVILGKTKGETLLDVTLGESCFERIARTGIAVSVWEDVVGPNGEIGTVNKVGGVLSARARVYMIQMKTERECAFSFSLLGKHRY